MIRIAATDSNFEREPLIPYHFKGGVMSELWQVAALLKSESGTTKVGLCTQSPLWSDAKVFSQHSPAGSNALMYAMTSRALQMVKGEQFTDPLDLIDRLYPEILKYGRTITGRQDLRKTFALNALVSVDNAAWMLYFSENKFRDFDAMVPPTYAPGLSFRNKQVASMPAFSVGADMEKIAQAAKDGYYIFKMKIGAAGTQQEMLEKDIAFLTAVHKTLGDLQTTHTDSGRLVYYFDANGRYEKKDTLARFIDHAKRIGAFDRIAVIEEPFEEDNTVNVADLGVTIAADESAHTAEDAKSRVDQGYSAIALKPVAKTLSMTMRIANLAAEKNLHCFCADLTVNPLLVDWNKNVAARVRPFPGLQTSILETNGHQYYKNWDRLFSYLPDARASWTTAEHGAFTLDKDFYSRSGGIFDRSAHYEELFSSAE